MCDNDLLLQERHFDSWKQKHVVLPGD